MTPRMRRLTFAPSDPVAFKDAQLMAPDELTLGEFLRDHPAFCLQELTDDHLALPVTKILIDVAEPTPATPLFLPPGMAVAGFGVISSSDPPNTAADETTQPPSADKTADGERKLPAGTDHPRQLSEREAVLFAHDHEISRAAAYLESGLSVLIQCEKLLVEHLAAEIAGRSGRVCRTVRIAASGPDPSQFPLQGSNRRSELVAALQATVVEAADGDVVVVPHLDLLAGGNDAVLTSEARELTDLLYERSGCVLLAFTDPSLVIPDVLANRFAVRRAIDILPREVITTTGSRVVIGRALVTSAEAELFGNYNDVGLYKHVAGMNAVRLRHALQFAFHQHQHASPPPTFGHLLQELREFKARTSTDSFEVPNTQFGDIGGYQEVKDELEKAVNIINGAAGIDEKLRPHLVPRGFIFYGPPGTGKTLFAKAIATKLGGNILVVSGPEVTDKYVGESERKVRDLFAQARRNAPSVVVFDEFDSIASQRTGRDDGGSRAGNAIVAQLLTELDGFRAELPVLIIGTTNRIDLIDDALLRPSRFRPISIGLPDRAARREIAHWHATYFDYRELSPALLDRIADATEGMNGDEIGSVFRDARADELVGTGKPADAHRFGRLVGMLRRAQQQRDIERGRRPARPTTDRDGRSRLTPIAGHRGPRTVTVPATDGPATDEQPRENSR